MHTSDHRSPIPSEGSARSHELTRREVLQIAGAALGVAAGCGPAGTGESVVLTDPEPKVGEAVAVVLDDSRHRSHRLAFLTGDTSVLGYSCEVDCTACLHDHEYGGFRTWH